MGQQPSIRKHIRKGRNPWYTIHCGGKEHYLGTDYARAHAKSSHILEHAGLRRTAPATVMGLCQEWLKGRKTELWRVAYWMKFAESVPLAALDNKHMQRFADWLTKQRYRHVIRKRKDGKWVKVKEVGKCKPLGRWTIRHRITDARTVWRWGIEQGWIAVAPGPASTPKPVQRPRDEDPKKLRGAIEKLPARVKPLVMFIANTGCRPAEARLLEWSEVDAQIHSKVLTLDKHKADRTGEPRPIYLTGPAITILNSQPRSSRWVFPNRNGKPYGRTGIRSILRRRGIRSIYSIRHTFAQWFLDHGGEDGGPGALEELQKLLGHKHLSTTQIYAQVREARMKRVAKRIKGPLAS